MPKIDWTPGSGAHGRPIRKMVGIDQRQGLILLSVVSGVMVLLAGFALIGGFNDPAPATKPPGLAADADRVAPTTTVSPIPADPAKASKLLLASTQHYADMFAAGQKAVGHTRYANAKAASDAVADSGSPAAQLIAYRSKQNPEGDVGYTAAADDAFKAFGTAAPPTVLATWSTDMGKVHSDLTSWVGIAVKYQSGAAAQADLDAAATAVTADLAAAKTDATQVAMAS
jgi:hypothetical protein